MKSRPGPNVRKRLLGRKLRRLREELGLTQTEAGKPLRFNDNKMSRIELGHLPKFNEYLNLLDRLGVLSIDYEEWIQQYDRAMEKGWWHAYGLTNQGYVPLEADADHVRTYELGLIPGLLQTEAGMRAAFDGVRDPMPPRKIETGIAIRQRRQLRLTEEPLLTLHAIIDESVLRRPDLPSADQRKQLTHIIERAELPNVMVQVIPLHLGIHHGRISSFTVLSYGTFGEPDIAYVEHGFGSLQIEKAEEVKLARLVFDHLTDLALDGQDSIQLIREVIDET